LEILFLEGVQNQLAAQQLQSSLSLSLDFAKEAPLMPGFLGERN
jgi:hypothetical protein